MGGPGGGTGTRVGTRCPGGPPAEPRACEIAGVLQHRPASPDSCSPRKEAVFPVDRKWKTHNGLCIATGNNK